MVSDEPSMLYSDVEEDDEDDDDVDEDYDVSSESDDDNNPNDREDDISAYVNPLSSTIKNYIKYNFVIFSDVNRLDMQEHQGVVTRAKTKQLKSHKDQIEQEKFQGLNFDVQDFMGLKF
ncbi:hypothetical protein M9H77_12260 [Catharanthus roseus]|uniref:Uncharacterized protein n=1 Tax=Catharanthus roseus TaxID=4058 RepID=A0ACC0BGV5_CATRO|nr:hypothetical protein M9H77_12260 [Catharanthus roseus]